jgi:hypothetical protein
MEIGYDRARRIDDKTRAGRFRTIVSSATYCDGCWRDLRYHVGNGRLLGRLLNRGINRLNARVRYE